MATKNNLAIHKRKDMVAWDAISNCTEERCPAHEMCPYMKALAPCRIQKEYIEAFLQIVSESLADVMDAPLKFRMGMHLVPLYKGLCRMKIAELGVTSVIGINDKGGEYVHPIFNEIRKQVDVIEKVWKNLGIADLFFGSMPDVAGLMEGDDYYTNMANEAELDDLGPEERAEAVALMNAAAKPTIMLRADYVRKIGGV